MERGAGWEMNAASHMHKWQPGQGRTTVLVGLTANYKEQLLRIHFYSWPIVRRVCNVSDADVHFVGTIYIHLDGYVKADLIDTFLYWA